MAKKLFGGVTGLICGALLIGQIVVNPGGSGGGGGTPGGSDTQVQFNDNGSFGGDAGLTWDATANALRLNVQPLLTGVADDANNSEPMLVIYPASGSGSGLSIASSFVDGTTYTGLNAYVTNTSAFLGTQIDGSSSTTSLTIAAGSGGLGLTTSGHLSLFSETGTILNGNGATAALQTAQPSGNAIAFQAYDLDGATYKTFATLTNGNTPSLTIANPAGGTVSVQGTYKSSDGTAGVTVTTCTGFKDGLCVSGT